MYTALKNMTHFSLRQSIQRPEPLVKRAKALGMTALGISDVCTLAGAIEFTEECKKQDIKPILGLKLNTNSGSINVIAKNKIGWLNLIKLVSKSQSNFHGELPITTMTMLQDHAEGLIGICGAPHSIIANNFRSPSNEVDDCYLNEVINLSLSLKDIFSGRFYLDTDSTSNLNLLTALRTVSFKSNIPCLATAESIFSSETDLNDYKILACSDRRCTLKELGDIIEHRYFRTDNQLSASTAEIERTQELASLCESYSITNKPKLPKFPCPDNYTEKEYLEYLIRNCRRYQDIVEFKDRLNIELPVINEAELNGYFLIVNDYTQYARSKGGICLGRGSAAGSLVAYLLELTAPNPLTYNLLWERFYNSGRNTKDHISYPDIDMDFPINMREEVIQYIKDKYGHNQVAQMMTFGRLQGAGALKEVFRAHNACDVNTMNLITENIPDEASIADDLENDDEESIIRWVLHNRPKIVEDYARIADDGSIIGDYAQYFEQAIRVEGVYRNAGKHAAGIVIAPEPLDNICPMMMDSKRETKIVGMDMKAAEKLGLIKMDILGVAALDKLQYARELIRGNK